MRNSYNRWPGKRIPVRMLMLPCILLCMLVAGRAGAQTFKFYPLPFYDSLKLRTIVGTPGFDTITVRHSDYTAAANSTSAFTVKSLLALTTFKVDVKSLQIHQKPKFTYVITYRTIGISNPAAPSPTVSNPDTLSVSFDRDSLALINDRTFSVAGKFHELKVIVQDVFEVTTTGNSTVYTPLLPADSSTVPTFVHVFGEVHLQKFINIPNLNMLAGSVQFADQIATTGTVNLNWSSTYDYIKPAGYEVEWTYTPGPLSGGQYNFRNNSTRIFTNATSFKIPIAEKKGFVVWRIRMVRPSLTDLLSRTYGGWTVLNDAGALNSSALNNCRLAIPPSANDTVNWDLKMSFVEDGKYKQVMTYYDGLLKQKQVQTRFNSVPGYTIVAQNLYDHEGRAVISSLPVPVKDRTRFEYLPGFLRPTNTFEYPKLAYDALPDTTICPPVEIAIPRLDTGAPANKYYARNNPNPGGINAFIPDAEGFPMTRKVLAAENPEKVLFEGQAGAPLQLGYGRHTEYLYGSPLQAELNKFFGQDVGKYNYYRKMITTDNHRQDMFSITDDAGKPVASGLIGSVDTNVLAFGIRNLPAKDSFKSNLLPIPNIRLGDVWKANGSHFVERDANYKLQYRMNYAPFKPCPNIAQRLLPKLYFRYQVIDNCGFIKVQDAGALGEVGVTTSQLISYAKDTGALLLRGNHVWNKESYIKMEDVVASVDEYLNLTNGCFRTFDDFLKQEVLATKFPCPPPSDPCADMRLAMMREMYPRAKYGQYAYADTVSKTFGGPKPNSIFSLDGGKRDYLYQNACITYPDTVRYGGVKYTDIRALSQQQFINIFNDSIAAALLPLHPDYCKLQLCAVLNNPYCKVLGGIDRAADAQNIYHYTLYDIAKGDPLVDSNILTITQLSTNASDSAGIDTMAFRLTVCGSELGMVQSACEAIIDGQGPADIAAYPVYMQDEYYRNLVMLYTASREKRLGEHMRTVASECGPCSDYRLYNPTADTIDAVDDTTLFVGTMDSMNKYMDLPLNSTASGLFSPSFSADSLTALTNLDNSALCTGYVGSIMRSLENCNATAIKMTTLRAALTARFCTANQSITSLTYNGLTRILDSLGIDTSDLCNAGLADLRRITRGAGDVVKLGAIRYSPLYYEDMEEFLQSEQLLAFIANNAGSATSTVELSLCDDHPFEQALAQRLGVAPTPANCSNTITANMAKDEIADAKAVRLRFSYGGQPVDYFLYSARQTQTNPGNAGFGYNGLSDPAPPTVTSLFNPYGFDRLEYSFANRNTVLLTFEGTENSAQKQFQYFLSAFNTTADWNAMEADGTAPLNGVGCAELLPMTRSTLARAAGLGLRWGHPLFGDFFANTTNYENKINFAFDNYSEAIRSCGITDSLLIPKHTAHFEVTLPATASIENYVDDVRDLDTVNLNTVQAYQLSAGQPMHLLIDVSPGTRTFRQAYQSLINRKPSGATVRYLPYLQRDTLAQLLVPGFNASMVTTAGLLAAVPNATITSASCTLKHYIPGYGLLQMPGSQMITVTKSITPDYEYNHAVDAIQRYLAGVSPMTLVLTHAESGVSPQYADWQMEAWRDYVRTLPASDPNQVVKGSKPDKFQALAASGGGSSFATSDFSYESHQRPWYRNDLFIDHAPTGNSTFAYIKSLLLSFANVNQNAPSGQYTILKPTATGSFLAGLGGTGSETRAYVCGDTTTFWINHFTTARKMINVFVELPRYLPRPRKDYRVVSITKGFAADSVMTLNLTMATATPGVVDTIHCSAHTNLSLGQNYVIPSAFLTSHAARRGDLHAFESCENAKLQTLYPAAGARYALYRDSARASLIGRFRQHIIDSMRESLDVIGNDIKHGVTLYYYDMAGNLIKTVSPAGVAQLSVMGAANDTINNRRLRNEKINPSLPLHTKVTSYRYNAQNKVIRTSTPDAGTTVSRYDRAGRVAFSQDARQASPQGGGRWTYFIYDRLSRVVETGEISAIPVSWGTTPYATPNTTLGSPVAADIKFQQRTEVTVTVYDTASYAAAGPFATQAPQDHLKNRVSCVKYFEAVAPNTDASKDTAYAHALHYSYDLSGNVKTLVHDLRTLLRPELRIKRVDYEYDLYSGKVLAAAYNRGLADQFFQRYKYDEDNRIVEAESSGNGIVWDRDAHYDYYLHGPLGRTSLGEQRVQGVDYAYTINGWLKATNGTQRDYQSDLGADGEPGSVTPPDVFSQRIHYFARDYRAIGDSLFFDHLPVVHKNLYNGNIAAIGTALAPFANLQSAYHYDPLQRIDRARYTTYNYDRSIPQSPTLAQAPVPDWASDYTYDPDGNLRKLKRRGGTVPQALNGGTAIPQQMMDSLTYRYSAGRNRLRNLQDSATSTAYGIDIPPTMGDTAIQQYAYDSSGNMTRDLVSGINLIEWNRFGKVSAISKADGMRITFAYDALGNRLAKEVVYNPAPDSLVKLKTVYVRDASGNSLAVYEDKKEYDLVRITKGSITADPGFGAGPGKLPASWTNAVATGLVGAYATDPSKDLAKLARALPELGDYALDLSMMESLTNDLTGPEALAFTKSVPAITHYALGGVVSEEEQPYDPTADVVARHLDPILLSDGLEAEQSAVLAAIKTADYDLYRALVESIPAEEEQKENFPDDPRLLEAFREMDLGDKTTISADMADALSKAANRPSLDAVRPVVVEAFSAANGYGDFVTEVPRADLIFEGLREDALSYLSHRYGQTQSENVPLDTVAAQFRTNAVLASALSGQLGGTPDAEVVSKVVSDHLPALLTLAGNAGQDAVLLSAIQGTVIPIHAEPFWVVWLQTRQVLTRDRMHLAEHHLYGSSRLGMQKYLPSALSFDAMAPAGPGTYQTLIQRKPWYSRYGADLFGFTVYGSNTLGSAQTGTAGLRPTSHLLGQRHYELTNHLGNVQATVLDRTSPIITKSPRGTDTVVGYVANISTAQDYYPFGMYMPGRYVSDTARHCVTTNQTVMVQQTTDIYAHPGGIKLEAHLFGTSPTPPSVGGLPVASGGFAQEPLHLYHYIDPRFHPNGWVGQASVPPGDAPGLQYEIDLSGEPSGIGAYLHLHLDTSVSSQPFSFSFTPDANREVEAEVRVRQYSAAESESYEPVVEWRSVAAGGLTAFSVPVSKWAVAAGGKTVVEWRFTKSRGGTSFGSGVQMKILSPRVGLMQWVAVNRVVRTCEERDNYRFGFNGQEKDNEAKGLGNQISFNDYGLDTRLGIRLNRDPQAAKFPSQSPYSTFNGNPIFYIDPSGEDGIAFWDNSAKTKTLVIKADYHYIKGQFDDKVLQAVNKEYARYNKISYNGEKVSVRFEIGFVPHDEGTDLSKYNGSAGQNRLLNVAIKGERNLEESNYQEVGVDNAGIAGGKSVRETPDGKMTSLEGNGVFEMLVSSLSHGIGHNLGLIHDDEGVMLDQQALTHQHERDDASSPGKKIVSYSRTFTRNSVTKSNVQNLVDRVRGMTEKGRNFWKEHPATQKEPSTTSSGVVQLKE